MSPPLLVSPIAAAAPAAAPLLLIGLSEVKVGHVHRAGISPGLLGKGAAVLRELVGLEIHVRLEDDKLLLHALFVTAEEVVVPKVLLQLIVVSVIVGRPGVPPIADEAALVLVTAMLK